jgi:putative ABC transport system ATP-binding protein
LRAIYRDLLIDSGSILLDNEDITNSSNYKIPIIRRKIGMIFQDFKLLNNRTVLENVGMPLRIIGCSKSYMIDKVNSILTKVGLAGLNNVFPYELSGGEQQRVCIARALVNNPKIILADEPTGALDSTTSREVMALIQRINDEGKTILVVTHEHDIANMCKRIVHLKDGIMVEDKKIKQNIIKDV